MNKPWLDRQMFPPTKIRLVLGREGEKGELTATHDIFIPKKTHRNVTIYIKTRLKKEIV